MIEVIGLNINFDLDLELKPIHLDLDLNLILVPKEKIYNNELSTINMCLNKIQWLYQEATLLGR